MKKLIYLIVVIVALALIVAGCTTSVVPPVEQTKAAKGAVWHVPGDFTTIQDAVDNASDGDTIIVSPGEYAGAIINKQLEILGEKEETIINDGPQFITSFGWKVGFWLSEDSSGTTIKGFTFECEEVTSYGDEKLVFPIFSRGTENITVDHCIFLNSLQAVTNWHGSGWDITHNVIQDLQAFKGGGIGIFCGSNNGGVSNDNLVSHNKITGTLHVWSSDGGGYCGTGIVLYADFRYSPFLGAEEIAYNRVVHNKVSLTSDNPDVVDVVAIELTDSRDDKDADPYPVIFGNAIGFNDLRGTELQIVLTPKELGDCNDISRNLGDNRGHGLHPSVFGPGGN